LEKTQAPKVFCAHPAPRPNPTRPRRLVKPGLAERSLSTPCKSFLQIVLTTNRFVVCCRMKEKFHLVAVTANQKLGPMPAAYSPSHTCPDSCRLKNNGCYAGEGPIKTVWNRIDRGEIGSPWKTFLTKVRNLEPGQVWRFGTTGDLPGRNRSIDSGMLAELVAANAGKMGYTYTHKPMTRRNISAVAKAVAKGFVINISADSPRMADRLTPLGLPMVTMVSGDTSDKFITPAGRPGIICPAQSRDNVTCKQCRLCARPSHILIGFHPHGNRLQKVEKIIAEAI